MNLHRMKYSSITLLICIILNLKLSLVGGSSSSSTDGETRSKAAPEPVEANKVESPAAPSPRKTFTPHNCSDPQAAIIGGCPTSASSSTVMCSELPANCLQCRFNCSCVYGQKLNVTCTPKPEVTCMPGSEGGGAELVREMVCQYCYQTPAWQHSCTGSNKCKAVETPRPLYSANCTVSSDVVCLGRRSFLKRRECNWTAGYHWATALTLSLTLGGFGADRFYLGHWQEGIGKLFSFGGLGVWTIMDVILIAIRYLGPADGSLYI